MSRTNELCLTAQCRASLQALPARGAAGTNANLFARIMNRVCLWQDRMHERAHLAALPDYLLRDMGLTRDEAVKQSARPFWQA